MPRSDMPHPGTVMEKKTCPSCGHFALMKLDEQGRHTKGEAHSYMCPIWPACGKKFPKSE